VSVHDETKEKDFKDKYEHVLLFVLVISQRSFDAAAVDVSLFFSIQEINVIHSEVSGFLEG